MLPSGRCAHARWMHLGECDRRRLGILRLAMPPPSPLQAPAGSGGLLSAPALSSPSKNTTGEPQNASKGAGRAGSSRTSRKRGARRRQCPLSPPLPELPRPPPLALLRRRACRARSSSALFFLSSARLWSSALFFSTSARFWSDETNCRRIVSRHRGLGKTREVCRLASQYGALARGLWDCTFAGMKLHSQHWHLCARVSTVPTILSRNFKTCFLFIDTLQSRFGVSGCNCLETTFFQRGRWINKRCAMPVQVPGHA